MEEKITIAYWTTSDHLKKQSRKLNVSFEIELDWLKD